MGSDYQNSLREKVRALCDQHDAPKSWINLAPQEVLEQCLSTGKPPEVKYEFAPGGGGGHPTKQAPQEKKDPWEVISDFPNWTEELIFVPTNSFRMQDGEGSAYDLTPMGLGHFDKGCTNPHGRRNHGLPKGGRFYSTMDLINSSSWDDAEVPSPDPNEKCNVMGRRVLTCTVQEAVSKDDLVNAAVKTNIFRHIEDEYNKLIGFTQETESAMKAWSISGQIWHGDGQVEGYATLCPTLIEAAQQNKTVEDATNAEYATELWKAAEHYPDTFSKKMFLNNVCEKREVISAEPKQGDDAPGAVYEQRTFAGVTVDVPVYENDNDMARFISKVDSDYIMDDNQAQFVMRCLKSKQKVFWNGPCGCGKTSLLEQVAAKLKYPFMKINFDAKVERENIIGRWVVKDGEMVWVDGLIPQGLKKGFMIVLDEYDSAPAEIQFILQSVLDNGPLINTENNEVVWPARGTYINATGNSGGLGDETGAYTGLSVINAATLDRWEISKKVDYPPPVVESKILKKRFPEMEDDHVTALTEFAQLARTARNGEEINFDLSMRRTQAACAYFLYVSGDWEETIRSTVANFAGPGDREVVLELAQRKFGW